LPTRSTFFDGSMLTAVSCSVDGRRAHAPGRCAGLRRITRPAPSAAPGAPAAAPSRRPRARSAGGRRCSCSSQVRLPIKPRTIMCCAVVCVMLAACQSVPEARQNSRMRSGTLSAALSVRRSASWPSRHSGWIRGRDVMEYRIGKPPGSIRLDACELDHLGPLFGLGTNELPELGG